MDSNMLKARHWDHKDIYGKVQDITRLDQQTLGLQPLSIAIFFTKQQSY